jgi:4-amino-4-deoxy-L-arabinose transferase-like glycosyltransferase
MKEFVAMGFLAIILVLGFVSSLIVSLVGGIWLLIMEFRKSIWWGLGGLFLHLPVNIAFAVTNWTQSRNAFLLWLGGGIIALLFSIGSAVVIPSFTQDIEKQKVHSVAH